MAQSLNARPIAIAAVLVATAAAGSFGQTRFTDAAYVFPGVEPCPDDYSQTADCYNELAPPAPSVERSLVTPSHGYEVLSYNNAWEVPLDEATQTFDLKSGPKSQGHGLVLPFTRATSHDGRLALMGRKPPASHPYRNITDNTLPSIVLFRPENVGSDITTGPNPGFEQGAIGHLHPVMYQDPRDSNVASRYDLDASKLNGPGTFHMSLCEDADPNPRFCSAPLTKTEAGSSEVVVGDCYDETVLVSLERGDALHKWELRSVPLTVFVPEGKTATNSEIYLYPRTAGPVLPALSEIEELAQVGVGQSWNEVLASCNGSPDQPFYCQYVNSQSYLRDFQVHRKDDWQNHPDPYVNLPGGEGNSYYFTFLEAITTSDGHLLVLNGGSSIYYAYNEDRCVASGFDRFEPLSKMPVDPEIYVNYDIARSQRRNGQAIPFRDSLGQPITPGDRIDGAYPWMDRAGKNILFSHQNAARDHYYASDIHPRFTSTNSKPHDHPDHKNRYNPDREPGKQVAVIGAWTQGKTVIVDNVSHPTDFGGVYNYSISGINFIKSFEMELYQGGPSLVRPRAPRGMSSFENQFNHVASLSPVSPFDVVWTVSTDTQRNSELVFDEYLSEGAVIVAHMNAPVQNVANIAGQSFRALPADGFVAQSPEKSVRGGYSADFGFKESPWVQNAATSHPDFRDDADPVPSHLVLRGGARVEPVALGGVVGKGIYLDGFNDFLQAELDGIETGDWFVGTWLDSRDPSSSQLRTVFHFPDGSWIALSRSKIRTFHENHPQPLREMAIAGLELQPGEFFHFAVKVRTVPGKAGPARRIEVFVNGTRVERKQVSNLETGSTQTANHIQYETVSTPGFDLAGPYPFALGDPGPQCTGSCSQTFDRLPFKGWVDELRVYRLDQAATQKQSFFDEFVCNLSLGSLVRVQDNDYSPWLRPLANRAWQHGLFLGDPPLREANDLAAAGGPGVTVLFADDFELGHFGTWTDDGHQSALVCEQLKIESFSGVNEFAPQHGRTLCAGRVHKNPHPSSSLAARCVRDELFAVADKPLLAGEPRPDFSTSAFCQSCHDSQAHIDGLRLEALSPGAVPREQDPRRQPLDHIEILAGCTPDYDPFPSDDPRCALGQFMMDWVFDYQPKVESD